MEIINTDKDRKKPYLKKIFSNIKLMISYFAFLFVLFVIFSMNDIIADAIFYIFLLSLLFYILYWLIYYISKLIGSGKQNISIKSTPSFNPQLRHTVEFLFGFFICPVLVLVFLVILGFIYLSLAVVFAPFIPLLLLTILFITKKKFIFWGMLCFYLGSFIILTLYWTMGCLGGACF